MPGHPHPSSPSVAASLRRSVANPFPTSPFPTSPLFPPAFSLLELILVLAIISILIAISLALMTNTRSSAASVKCLSNLRQIHAAFHLYTSDNSGHFPDPLQDQISWEKSLRKYLNPAVVFQCPADHEIFPAVGSSYDWRDTGDPLTTLAGGTLKGARSNTILAFESLPGWHAKNKMNAVRVDGSAHTLTIIQCLSDLQKPVAR